MLDGTVRQAFFHSPEQLKLLIVFIGVAVAIIFISLPQPNATGLDTEMPSLKDANVLNLKPRVLNSNLAYRDQVLLNLLNDYSLNVLPAPAKVDKPVHLNNEAITRLKNLRKQRQGRGRRTGAVKDASTA